MLTVLESLNLSADFLQKKGIESARTNAELLLSAILDCKRLDLYLQFNRPLSNNEISLYRNYIARRGKSEPLQYIIGNVEFYGMKLKVNNSVLIPRPETEILVEEILNSVDQNKKIKILDIGAGSGNITLALAFHLKSADVIGLDVSKEALNLANLNRDALDLSEKVDFICSNIFEFDSESWENQFDLIVSNPPYVSKDEYPTLQKEIVYFEPSIALTDNDDGYKFYKHISWLSKRLLRNKGKLFFEIGQGQAEKVTNAMTKNGFVEIAIKKDYAEIERVIHGIKK